jgi:hypothetical protein
MNEESRPARRLPNNSVGREVSTHYVRSGREHELDRMVAAATWRAERAKSGQGYVFKIPAKSRR